MIIQGDSGGPLVAKIDDVNRIIGISSWGNFEPLLSKYQSNQTVIDKNPTFSTGIGCGDGYPDVYTDVYAYSDWIQKHIQEN